MIIHYWNRRDARNRKMLALYRRVPDLTAVAKAFGIQILAARNALKKNGAVFPKTALRKKAACNRHKKLVLEMCADGRSLASIARRIGTKGATVKRFLRENGVTKEFPTASRKERHYNWKGGRSVRKDGYVLVHVPSHPHCRKHAPYVYEHRLVMEKAIGRYLLPEEVVHHRDGNPQNNEIENLQLFSENRLHLAHELKGRCPNWTPEGREYMRKSCLRKKVAAQERNRLKLKADARQSR